MVKMYTRFQTKTAQKSYPLGYIGEYPAGQQTTNRRPVGSVGRVPDYRAGGRGFKPRPDHHSGSLNNRGESAAFVMTSANG